jgi:hypothetical protein
MADGGNPMGEPAPNAGYREAIVKDIEKAIAGYCQGYRKGYRWLL